MNTLEAPRPLVSPFSILVGLDLADGGDFAFRQAVRIARGIPGCHLHLVHVFDGEPPEDERPRQLVDRLRTYANDEAAAAGGLQGVTIGIHLRAGEPVREIVQLASDVGAPLVVLGARKGSPIERWLLGSSAEKILAAAPCPVLVAGPKPPAPEAREPVIEPPCADCVRARHATSGDAWWCERHAQNTRAAHVFSYKREWPLAMHDSAVIPTGIKP